MKENKEHKDNQEPITSRHKHTVRATSRLLSTIDGFELIAKMRTLKIAPQGSRQSTHVHTSYVLMYA
jgi:hypothetical protein